MRELERLKEELSLSVFGRSVALAKAGNQCISCGKRADTFRDDISESEYQISCLCQACQDQVFEEVDSLIKNADSR